MGITRRTMPAGFNKGQIEYIKTIANVNGHKTYKTTSYPIPSTDSTVNDQTQAHYRVQGETPLCDDAARYAIWCLGPRPLMRGTGDTAGGNTNLAADQTITSIDVYNVPIQQNLELADEQKRVSPECFLESVNMKMRHITNLDADHDHDNDSHKEFRLIVFRHKEKQHYHKQIAQNHSNPLYDMFFGAGGYKYGPKGYRQQFDNEGNLDYVNHSGFNVYFDRDMMLTDSMNKDDYVVMKDCRYYLGREYGGKHIYEDRFHWDHEDPIATDAAELTNIEGDKNYCWYIMLLCSNNSPSNDAVDNLGYVRFMANTHVTSG